MNPSSPSESRLTLRERFRGATRDAILEAAGAVFAADRPSNARIEDIAARAGIAVGTVYNYFADRTALVSALLEMRTRALFDDLDAATPRTRTGSVASRFEADLGHFVGTLARHFDANKALMSALLEEERDRGIDARSASRRRSTLQGLLVRAEAIVARGMRGRALRKGDPALYAALLVGLVRGIAMSAFAREGATCAASAPEVVRVFLRGTGR